MWILRLELRSQGLQVVPLACFFFFQQIVYLPMCPSSHPSRLHGLLFFDYSYYIYTSIKTWKCNLLGLFSMASMNLTTWYWITNYEVHPWERQILSLSQQSSLSVNFHLGVGPCESSPSMDESTAIVIVPVFFRQPYW